MARYVLCRHAIGQHGVIEISEAEYQGLAADIDVLVELSDLEEKYNGFIDNYFELERGLLEEALRAMIYRDYTRTVLQGAKNTISRRIINLLTSIKLYLDSYPQHAGRLVVGEKFLNLKDAPSRAYDLSLSYRTMEALRNYAQHEAFPVHGWTVKQEWDTSTEPKLLRATVSPRLDLKTLAQSKRFKKGVLEELENTTSSIELKPLIREYIEQLWMVHSEFRTATSSLMSEAMSRVKAAVARFTAEYPGSELSVVALPVDEDGLKVGEPIYLSAPVVEYLPHLIARVGPLANYSRRRVDY
jgi:hypothetical protein